MQTDAQPEYDAGVLTQSAPLADYFERVVGAGAGPKSASNWVMVELLRTLNERGTTIAAVPLTPRALTELIALVDKGAISSSIAKDVFAKLTLVRAVLATHGYRGAVPLGQACNLRLSRRSSHESKRR